MEIPRQLPKSPEFNAARYVDDYVNVLKRLDLDVIDAMVDVIMQAWSSGRTVFAVGNGGSAATATHLAMDMAKLTVHPSACRRLRAMALTDSVSTISAIANDFSYEEVFAEQLRTFAEPDDVLIALSASGNSPNVLRAAEFSGELGMTTLSVTGAGGARLQDISQHALMVPSYSVQHIEDVMTVTTHLLCLGLRSRIELALPDTSARAASYSPVSVR